MDVSDIVIDVIPAIAKYVLAPATLIFVLLLLFVCWRSGSSHVFLLKTWLIVLGKTTIDSKVIAQFASRELDLTHFRHLSGIRVATLKDAESLCRWAGERNIGLRLIRKAGRFFDVEQPGPAPALLNARRWHVQGRKGLVLLIAMIMVLFLIPAEYPRAFIKVVSTEKHFTVDQHYASPVFTNEKFYFKDCGKEAKPGFIDATSLKVLCDMSTRTEFEKDVKETVFEQQLLSWLAFIYFVLPLILAFLSARRVDSAIKLREKLEKYEQARQMAEAGSDPGPDPSGDAQGPGA